MSSIETRRRNGKITYRAHYRDPAGALRSRSFARKIDARAFLTTTDSAKLAGSYIDPGRARLTVGALADEWLAGKVDLKPTTRALYTSVIETHVRPRWGTVPIGKVGHGDAQAWVADLVASGLSGGHVRKVVGVLAGILKLAVRDRRLPSSPTVGLSLPRTHERPRRYLTAVQVARLADAAARAPHALAKRGPGDAYRQYRLAVLVLAYCGLRWSELAALRVRSVDLMRRRLDVAEAMTEVNGGTLVWGTPKSHEARSVPIPRLIADGLMTHLAGKPADALVFTSVNGAPLRNRNARRAWFDHAAIEAGIPGLLPHELRHTAASLAVSAGANVKAVQRMLGHASAALTLDRYADLFDDDLDAVAERLDAVARAASVAPALPSGQIVDLAAARQIAAAQ
jgi:integrase